MATIARTEEMFQLVAQAETSKSNVWGTFVHFVQWILTPKWAIDNAQEYAMKNSPYMWV